MLKTNNKKFENEVKKLIIDNFIYYGFENLKDENISIKNFDEIAEKIYNIFKSEYLSEKEIYFINSYKSNYSLFDSFKNYLQGLPSCLPCIYYNFSCKDFLKEALEETEKEAKKYDESQAEDLLAYKFFKLLKISEKFYNF